MEVTWLCIQLRAQCQIVANSDQKRNHKLRIGRGQLLQILKYSRTQVDILNENYKQLITAYSKDLKW